METINAISKVRFGTAKPQRVQLHKGAGLLAEILCMEAAQKLKGLSGERIYYVIMGTADITANGKTTTITAGQFAAAADGETHDIANAGEGRLVCLVAATAS